MDTSDEDNTACLTDVGINMVNALGGLVIVSNKRHIVVTEFIYVRVES